MNQNEVREKTKFSPKNATTSLGSWSTGRDCNATTRMRSSSGHTVHEDWLPPLLQPAHSLRQQVNRIARHGAKFSEEKVTDILNPT
jgi:hypothetical protein